MAIDFKLFMVSVKWEDKNKIFSFQKSYLPLEPSQILNNKYTYDISTYYKVNAAFSQFAIETTAVPFWNGTPLYCIPETKIWINKGEWIATENSKYHKCQSINTAGELNIKFKAYENSDFDRTEIYININPNIEGFDFEILKEDFEASFWQLLISNESKITASKALIAKGENVVLFPEFDHINTFLKIYDEIVLNPKCDLRPAVDELPYNKIKPIPQTFKQYAISGTTKHLPSKNFKKYYDIYENRYIVFMLQTINKIVKRNIGLLILIKRRIEQEIKYTNARIEELNKNPVANPEKLKEDLVYEKEKLEKIKQQYIDKDQQLQKYVNNYSKKKIKHEEIKIKIFNPKSEIYYHSEKKHTELKFESPVPYALFEKDDEYIIECVLEYSNKRTTQKNKEYDVYKITSLNSIRTFKDHLTNQRLLFQKKKADYKKLESNNWDEFSILSDKDRYKAEAERKAQLNTLKNNLNELEKSLVLINNSTQTLNLLIPLVYGRLNGEFVKKITGTHSVSFRPTMTYIQNKLYNKANKCYNTILESIGIEIKTFELYEKLTNYGLRDLPILYELWCLTTIIKTIEENFHFKSNPADIKNLLNKVNPENPKPDDSVQINFDGDLLGRRVSLYYQKKMEKSEKRPDFILQIDCGLHSCKMPKLELVFDAKFKNFNSSKNINLELNQVRDKYTENKSEVFVFVIHPCQGDKLNNLGGEHIAYEEDFPMHKYGYFTLKPLSTENLKRAIGMVLEFGIEVNKNANKIGSTDPKPEHGVFCLACGETDVKEVCIDRGDSRVHYQYLCQNQKCKHEIKLDYCWNCQTKLFKHGKDWDYHIEATWNAFDIKCPCCGKTLAEKPEKSNY